MPSTFNRVSLLLLVTYHICMHSTLDNALLAFNILNFLMFFHANMMHEGLSPPLSEKLCTFYNFTLALILGWNSPLSFLVIVLRFQWIFINDSSTCCRVGAHKLSASELNFSVTELLNSSRFFTSFMIAFVHRLLPYHRISLFVHRHRWRKKRFYSTKNIKVYYLNSL